MLDSEKLAIAAHLHVLLRRKTGRVTDTEWMAANTDYAAEIVRFARAKALEEGHPDLAEWALRLEQAMAEASRAPARPLAQAVRERLQQHAAPAPAPAAAGEGGSGFGPSSYGESGFAESTLEPGKPRSPRDPNAPRYVGGIR
ncbi:hypothetical protein [Variovorax terrae]|uniref:Uncharacterized protein n=1 Tax=Variovorax terrae TaxID=2923278 RepID=A0A9X1VX22_9BURK|nr:hypothetical protein [Variovorax terrae]MCJ0765406.1 hypothetical protein [Variovorax terrae]